MVENPVKNFFGLKFCIMQSEKEIFIEIVTLCKLAGLHIL